MKKIIYVLQYAIVLTPLALMTDLIISMIKEDSIVDGFMSRFYDSLLDCTSFEYSRPAVLILSAISLINMILYRLLYKTERKEKCE